MFHRLKASFYYSNEYNESEKRLERINFRYISLRKDDDNY